MSLRLRLILTTSMVIAVLFGVSEWLSYRQTSELLDQHEAILIETTDHQAALARLQETKRQMLGHVTLVRMLHALLTMVVAVAVLNYVWYRVVYRPIRRLLAQIAIMGRGTWASAIPIHRNDEIGELTAAFNDLGAKLEATVRQITTASKLSAMALLGHGLLRKINVTRMQIHSSVLLLEDARDTGVAVPEAATANLTAAEKSLQSLEGEFETSFNTEVKEMSERYARPGSANQAPEPVRERLRAC
jgi:methyl-accepting chemotaxis protein